MVGDPFLGEGRKRDTALAVRGTKDEDEPKESLRAEGVPKGSHTSSSSSPSSLSREVSRVDVTCFLGREKKKRIIKLALKFAKVHRTSIYFEKTPLEFEKKFATTSNR